MSRFSGAKRGYYTVSSVLNKHLFNKKIWIKSSEQMETWIAFGNAICVS